VVPVEPLECAGVAAGSQRRINIVLIRPAGIFVLQGHRSKAELSHRGGLDRLLAQKVAGL